MLSVNGYEGSSVRQTVENTPRLQRNTTGTSERGTRDGGTAPYGIRANALLTRYEKQRGATSAGWGASLATPLLRFPYRKTF